MLCSVSMPFHTWCIKGFIPLHNCTVDYNLHWKVTFGNYAQTRNLTTNYMRAHTAGAILVRGSSTSFQGGVKFYSLEPTKTMNRSKNNYTLLHMPVNAILHMTQLAKDIPNDLYFTNRLGNIHASDPENNPGGPITIRFVDAPSDTQIIHD